VSYINTEWLRTDELAKAIIDSGEDITNILTCADDAIVLKALENGLSEDDILVDGSGYVDSVVLRLYGKYYTLWQMMVFYSGSGNGNSVDDAYAGKLDGYYNQVASIESKITKETIEGGDGSEPLPEQAMVKENYFIR
jgi:hypothetical protein